MAPLPLQNLGVLNGITPTYANATDTTGDTLPGGQGVFIHVKNANASSVDVIITTPESVDGDLDVEDRTVAVATGTELMIPVPARYNNASTGVATVVCDPASSVTIGAFRGPVQS